MKEKIEGPIEFQEKAYMFKRYFENNTPTADIMEIFQKSFPEEFKVWGRELIGGNKGAHNMIKDERT